MGGKMEREMVAGRRENPSGESSGVEFREAGPEASRVADNTGGDRQVVGGGVKSPRGTDTPGVEDFPWGDKTSKVTLEGGEEPGADIRERGGG